MAKDEKFADSIDAALLTPVRNYYNGDIFQVDFTGETALKQVDNWVSDRTDGMINPFLQQFTSPEKMRLLLINAIYFNGTWRSPFSPDDTVEATFHGLTSDSSVNMMNLHEEEYRYYSDNGMQGLELPYGEGKLVMDCLFHKIRS
jgi:serpin B